MTATDDTTGAGPTPDPASSPVFGRNRLGPIHPNTPVVTYAEHDTVGEYIVVMPSGRHFFCDNRQFPITSWEMPSQLIAEWTETVPVR